jgi:uracil DNA glycosylase
MEYFNKLKAMLSGQQQDPYKQAGNALGDSYKRAHMTSLDRQDVADQDQANKIAAIKKQQALQRWIADGNDPADFDEQYSSHSIMR